MMDLLNKLMTLGGGASLGAPEDASKLVVPGMSIDPSSSISMAGGMAAKEVPKMMQDGKGGDLEKLLLAGAIGVGQGMGGSGKKGEQQMIQAPAYRGGQRPQAISADKLSMAQLAGQQRFPMVGILGQSQ